MAKNYTMKEAVEIISAGTDMETIADIGRRYPILLHKVTKVATLAGNDFVDLMGYLPDHLTANKVNTAIKNNAGSDEEVEDDTEDAGTEVEKETPTKKAKAEKSEAAGTDYENMTGKELWDILGKAGKRKDCKDKMGGTKKELMIEYINKYGLDDTAEEEADEEVEADESENPYDGISAPELFKECKKRGIKAAAKKPAKYYVELLMKSDAEAAAGTEAEDEEDGWGDDEEEEIPTPTKAEKKTVKKTAKKPAKEEEADDDDDWDI